MLSMNINFAIFANTDAEHNSEINIKKIWT